MAKLYSVGVGAGSGSFITLGALRAIERSDIIAVPVKKHGAKSTALEIIKQEFDTDGKEILEMEFPMSHDNEVRQKSHTRAAEKILAGLRENKTVSMITLGDVSVYSTCSYVHKAISDAGFETEIIAGVPSFCAAADRARISLCEGNETVMLIPSPRLEQAERYIDDFDTLVIMKAGGETGKIYELLQKHNLQNNAVVCGNIGMENETIAKIKPDDNYGYFTTIIIKKKFGDIK